MSKLNSIMLKSALLDTLILSVIFIITAYVLNAFTDSHASPQRYLVLFVLFAVISFPIRLLKLRRMSNKGKK